MKTCPSLTQHSDQIIHNLALQASRRLVSFRLLLGRCLLEAQRRRFYVDFGCSNLTQYMVHILKLNKKEARAFLRVAVRLEDLPLIAREAEKGLIDWSKLRDTLHKITPKTEKYWLALYHKLSYKQLMHLVARTPVGGIPGDELESKERLDQSELICRLEADEDVLVSRALRSLSRQEGRVVSFNEAVVLLFADYLAGAPDEPADEVERETESRQEVLDEEVEQARELAKEMGLLSEENCPARDSQPGEAVADETTSENSIAELEGEQLFRALVAFEEEEVPGLDCAALARRQQPAWEDSGDEEGSDTADRTRFNAEARCATPAQRRHLIRRERYCCASPGCQNHTWLEAHHLIAYAAGGVTLPSNLIMLCSACHRLVHEGKLKITGEAPDKLSFEDSQGRDLERDTRQEDGSFLAMWIDYSLRFWMGELTRDEEVVPSAGEPMP